MRTETQLAEKGLVESVRRQHGVSEDDGQSESGCWAEKTMIRDESASLVAVEEFRWVPVIATHNTHACRMPKNVIDRLLTFYCPQISVLSFLPSTICCFFYCYFCSTREMPTWPGVRSNNGVFTRRTNKRPTSSLCGLFHRYSYLYLDSNIIFWAGFMVGLVVFYGISTLWVMPNLVYTYQCHIWFVSE